MSWRHGLLALLSIICLASGGKANAQASSARIQDPLPNELKGRAARLLRSIRPADADAALAHSKIIDGLLWRETGLLFLRIDTGCVADLCMTMIARVNDGAIIPEIILRSKSSVIFYDELPMLWGARQASLPIAFEGRDSSAIIAYDRDGTWVLEACSNCFPELGAIPVLGGSASSSPTPAEQPRVETFEEFRRAIGTDP